MNKSQDVTNLNHSIYRDFTLFALAAVGVGLAVSLTLATAVVLSVPSHDTTIRNTPVSESTRFPKTRFTRTLKASITLTSI